MDEPIVYGPYRRKDGREIVVFYDGKKTTSMSFPRILTGAEPDEEVHHKDEDPSNNNPSNLEVLSKEEHRARHAKGPSMVDVTCANCDKTFSKLKKLVTSNAKQGYRNTCGWRCASVLGGKASGEARRKKSKGV